MKTEYQKSVFECRCASIGNKIIWNKSILDLKTRDSALKFSKKLSSSEIKVPVSVIKRLGSGFAR